MKPAPLLTAVFVLCLVFSPLVADDDAYGGGQAEYDPQEPIPLDPKVRIGSFENGLKYYIRTNSEPENRAQFWLAVNAGSVLEDDDQKGLAHFVEHMAFNGTEHFSKNELIHYLESIGMRFGPELNAFTSFDETVYMLEVPTDTVEYVETAFQILEDWARGLTFDEEEIDKERGVIGEEWRLGRGAQMRMLDEQLPVLFKDSRYAERLTIGDKAVIDTCHYETLRRFYDDWYRPDLMAVIAVGEFDPEPIEALIESHFASLPIRPDARERLIYPVPDHDETLIRVATDPEATHTTTAIIFKNDPRKDIALVHYRRRLAERLHDDMLNDRLTELTKTSDPPFLFALTTEMPLARSKRLQMVAALVKEDGIEGGLEALLLETARANRHGFTGSELERSKQELIRGTESAFAEREKTKSKVLASECLNHFLRGQPMPGIENEYDLVKAIVPGITLQEINALAEERVSEENRVVLVAAPEKEGLAVPSEEDLRGALTKVAQTEVAPYEDAASDKPLVPETPFPAEITEESRVEELGVTEWTLSNGIHVVLKPTDFKNDEILFRGYSTGGTSLATNEEHTSAVYSSQIIAESGVGDFSSVELDKKLSGAVVEVSPYIDEVQEGLRGSASPKDMETMFKLIYLYVTAPRKDTEAFESYRVRMNGIVENRSASPEAAFFDTLTVTISQHHHRARPLTKERLSEIELQSAYDFYLDRFADTDDFVFIFVGNFELDSIRPLVLSYLGALPATEREESWRDPGVELARGVIKKTVEKGIEKKGRVAIAFTGPLEWSRENLYAIESLASIMEIDLREVLREELGGTYSVGITQYTSLYPKQEYHCWIMFGCDPDRIDELTSTVFEQIDRLKAEGPDKEYVERVREAQNRQYEVNLRDNGFWLRELVALRFSGSDPRLLLRYPELVEGLSVELIRDAANEYLNGDNYVQVTLVPEGD